MVVGTNKMQNAERKMQNAELGKREEGKQIYISLLGNPLFPHPSSLKLYILLVEDEEYPPYVRFLFCLNSEHFCFSEIGFKGKFGNIFTVDLLFINLVNGSGGF